MKPSEFAWMTLAVAIGTLVALAIAGIYVKQQVAADTAGSSTLSTVLSLFTPKTTS